MTVTVKNRTSLSIPPQLQRRAGFKPGDRVEFKVSGGVINIIPELPSANDEYTPAQRRVIDAELKEARKGPYYGPFDTAAAAITHMKGQLRKRAAAKKIKSRPSR
jgi:bifunctional DNA-binding transcriptional regulator/antitoxin component of YhaV-PrlF toxin-antitoxin module